MKENKMLLRIDEDLDFYLETVRKIYKKGKTEYINNLIRKDKETREETGELKRILKSLKTIDNFKSK